MMTVKQLKDVMKFQLKNFAAGDTKITDNTRHDEILSDEGLGSATPKRIYRSFIRWTLDNNGHKDATWPANWIERTVADLAALLIGEDK